MSANAAGAGFDPADPFGNVPLVLTTLAHLSPARRRFVLVRECIAAYLLLEAVGAWLKRRRSTAASSDKQSDAQSEKQSGWVLALLMTKDGLEKILA